MGHITSKNYIKLQKRLDDQSQGAPRSEVLYKILELLFSEKEAKLASVLPINYFYPKEAARRWKVSEKEALKTLNDLADKGILLDINRNGEHMFIMAPTMAGFFEFSLMRTDGKFNYKVLSELYTQYINQEDDFVKRIFGQETPIDRVYLHEDLIREDKSEVLDYEKVSHIIDTASSISVGRCYCRHKKEHLGEACDNPQNVCLTFNAAADSLIKHKVGKKISKAKATEIVDDCMKRGLMQIGDNVKKEVNWICNCCTCCCEAILSYKHLGYSCNLTSNFIVKNDHDKCIGCGVCEKKCGVKGIELVENNHGKKYAEVNDEHCIGCGVCARFCPGKSLEMIRCKNPLDVPEDAFQRNVMMAIETGTLPNYLFDDYNLMSHKVLRTFLGIFVRLPPAKQLLANKQLKSRFMDYLIKTKYYKPYDRLFNK